MIYLDNAATTKPSPEVIADIEYCLSKLWGNPSSAHTFGYKSKLLIEESREKIAETINANPSDIIFTSGGTEANNLVMSNFKNRKRYISSIEHHSILNNKYSINDCTKIAVDNFGIITSKDLEKYLSKNTSNLKPFVSIMMTNNEIGTVQDVKKLAAITHKYGGIFHTDAVAAYSHQHIDVKDSDVDLMTVSGHKWGVPKGVGFLYKKSSINMTPLLVGGHQEKDMRAGTENVAYIYAMANQAQRLHKTQSYVKNLIFSETRNKLLEKIKDIPGFAINSNLLVTQPNILNFMIEGIDAQQLIALLDERGFCVSAGSACSSGDNFPSHVLLAIGKTTEQARSSLRVSLSFDTKMSDLSLFAQALKRCVQCLKY